MKIIFTDHAQLRMDIRGISEDMVKEALANPDSTGKGYKNRLLAYKTFNGKTIKVVYAIEGESSVVISVMWEEG